MNTFIKTGTIALLAAAGLGLGGCVYYPVRTGVAYGDPVDGNAVVDYNDSATYYAPGYSGYYSDPYWYGPGYYGYGYGWPAVSLGFYGGYRGGHHYHDRGPWRGGWNGGGGHWNGGGRSSISGGARNVAPLSRGSRH